MVTLKPVPLFPALVKNLCPICGEATYSRAGIHPQCAVQQADEPRTLRLRIKKKRDRSIWTSQTTIVG